MQGGARRLKERLLPANRQIQAAGSAYRQALQELQQLMQIHESISAARQAIRPVPNAMPYPPKPSFQCRSM